MSNGIHIIKRDGSQVPLNIDKIHFVVEEACKGLAGVSSSQIEMNANIQFYDGMSTSEIQDIMIRSANDLISLENPNYNLQQQDCYYTEHINKCLDSTRLCRCVK